MLGMSYLYVNVVIHVFDSQKKIHVMFSLLFRKCFLLKFSVSAICFFNA